MLPAQGTVAPEPALESEQEEQEVDPADEEVPLEVLMDLVVTTVSRTSRRLNQSAAAAFVVTNEDIRRLGAQSLPEALRIVPGLQIGQIARSRWAVTSRGFANEYANKLLVLMDGRTVYSPSFSGTHWDVQDAVLEDLDRIEVIRGPGATLWGANAVNGIINVISKSAKDTQGWLIKGGTGTSEHASGLLRYGDALGDDTWFRVDAKWFDRDGFPPAPGMAFDGDWDAFRVGFRVDSELTDADRLMVQGTYYTGDASRIEDYSGGHVLTRWTHELSPTSDLSLQVYYDRTERMIDQNGESRDTLDVDFQHRFQPFEDHELIWGLGYRAMWDDIQGSAFLTFLPDDRRTQLYSAFVQDTYAILPEVLFLTAGAKVEHNDYSGFEVSPSARLLWNAAADHTVWAAVSRAIRAPSRTDHDLLITFPAPGPIPTLVVFSGDGRVAAENVIAYELGYRVHPADNLSFDLALFYNDYSDLRSTRAGVPFIDPMLGIPVVPITFDNEMEGEVYGVELAAWWNVFENWRLAAGYTFTQVQLHADSGVQQADDEAAEGDSPHHQFNVRSYWDIVPGLQLNTALYYVDNVPSIDIPGYLRWDVQIRWDPCENASVTAGVQNILDDRHPEFISGLGLPSSEIERLAYVSLELRF